MQRALHSVIKSDLAEKIVLLSGPRQSGKTTLALNLEKNHEYLNYDVLEDRAAIMQQSWRKDASLLILDELHKMKKWKLFLKGIYDRKKSRTNKWAAPILVTGSARLDIAKRAGDSLAGRHFSFRLHPFTLRELSQIAPQSTSLERLLNVGGFPEPYLSTKEEFPARWRRAHVDMILRQDVIDLEQVKEVNSLSTLFQLLRSRVGSTVSLNALAEDLQVDFNSVKRWISILENLYIIFRLTPWSKNIARSLLKANKFYFYDNGQVLGDEGAKFENLVACALLREVHWAEDTLGKELSLHYIRNKEKDEIDFCLVEKGQPVQLIEAKWDDEKPSKGFKVFDNLKSAKLKATQVVRAEIPTRDYPFGVRVTSADTWLRKLNL
jgi:uncharacterized protein